MCGIAGIAGRGYSREALASRVQRMTSAIRHRGPDGSGVRVFADDDTPIGAALGHRRLAIIDLSDAGAQPMSNEDGSVWVVFNGEIYNFSELRDQLARRGHTFRSATDTEVLVHLYEDSGPEFVKRLNGIFAFAILDVRRRKLLLARDHIGVKPLYYSVDSAGLSFGSEIKALLAARNTAPAVNWQAIYDYFTYLYVPQPQTAFEGILQLPPAHSLTYDLATGSSQLESFWRARSDPVLAHKPRRQLEQELYATLEQAVQRQLVSDVPLGIFLSGGIDSSILAGLARHSGVTPRTFTVDFSGSENRYYSEARIAEETSRYLGTEHQTLDVAAVDPIELLSLVDHFDQPFGNPTYYLQWLIAQRARQYITVALNGAGGDELFAGYPRYRAAQLGGLFHHIPGPILRATQRALGALRDSGRTMRLRRIREFISGLDTDPVREFTNWTYFLTAAEKAELLQPGADRSAPLDSARWLRRYYDESPFENGNRLLYVDSKSFLVDNLLEYTDRMSMAVGMEVRVPMLDPGFVELALNVPFGWKLSAGGSKQILRSAFRSFLTPAVRGAKKRGFNAPLSLWMRKDLDQYFEASQSVQHYLKDVLGDDIGRTWKEEGVLSWSYVDRMRREHREGRQDLSHELFSVIIFDVWWRKYISGTLPITRWSPLAEHASMRLAPAYSMM